MKKETKEINIEEYVKKFESLSNRSKREVCHFIAFLKYYEDNDMDNYEDDENEKNS